jgi:hypothetical protein
LFVAPVANHLEDNQCRNAAYTEGD